LNYQNETVMYALVVIDMQNDFVRSIPRKKANFIARNINALCRCFNSKRLPIYVVCTEHEPDGSDALPKAREEKVIPAIKGSEGALLFKKVTIPESAHIIKKKKYSAFFETSLARSLRNFRGALVVTGINTHACIRSTVVDACQMNMCVIIPDNCVASYDAEFHRETMRYLGSRVGLVLPSEMVISAVAEGRALFNAIVEI
jgi:nicotinamidase-related amidase